ncbi:MAG TPA: type I restriction enzyme HsdR N-terminal domain-containing protein [Pirellulales bacterium]|nr:type I restriction enzyme HsdR N-terminal domain-containing protein [Pirellulales bacterium]
MPIPKKVAERTAAGVKKFKPIVADAKSRDIGESDTVNIVVAMLSEIFGYDAFTEVTSEHAVKATRCDLAVKLDGSVQFLIEVKAIGKEPKDPHIDQAVNYGANLGIDWVVLTNAETWRVYRLVFAKPIDFELVFEFRMGDVDPKSAACLEMLYTLTKEGWQKAALAALYEHKKAMSRYCLGAIALSEPILKMIRRELKRLSPNVSVDVDELRQALESDVIKRDVLEGEKADAARKQVAKKKRASKAGNGEPQKPDAPTMCA